MTMSDISTAVSGSVEAVPTSCCAECSNPEQYTVFPSAASILASTVCLASPPTTAKIDLSNEKTSVERSYSFAKETLIKSILPTLSDVFSRGRIDGCAFHQRIPKNKDY